MKYHFRAVLAVTIFILTPLSAASALTVSATGEFNAIIPYSTTTSAASSTPSMAALQSLVTTLQAKLAALGAAKGTTVTQTADVNKSTDTFTRTLAFGSAGRDVSTLQQTLTAAGYYAFPTITGYFGPLTKKALAAYQAAHGLEPTGSVGPQTRALLNSVSVQEISLSKSIGKSDLEDATSSASSASSLTPPNWTTYTNKKFSFSISYPSYYLIYQHPDTSDNNWYEEDLLTLTDPTKTPVENAWPDVSLQKQSNLYGGTIYHNTRDYWNSIKNGTSNVPTEISHLVSINGMDAILNVYPGDDIDSPQGTTSIEDYDFIHNDIIYSITLRVGDPNNKSVLQSFHFIN